MKIAIVGTGPNADKAPFNHPDWEVWTIGGLHGKCTPARLYEIHPLSIIAKEFKDDPNPEKLEWMRNQNILIHPSLKEMFPNGEVFDYQRCLDTFGGYFTSSIAWMLADAILERPEKIALYGVTMSSSSEYAHQKPACTYLIGWAKGLGIEVGISEGSELLVAPYLYGLEEPPPMLTSFKMRQNELRGRIHRIENEFEDLRDNRNKLQGALEVWEFMEKNWYAGGKE